jgi:GntR family transcriptional regulator
LARPKSHPLYVVVAETIKGRIQSREYGVGERIPPARELEEEFNVSGITIRKAIELLTAEGWVEPRQGYGTVVTNNTNGMMEIAITGNFREWLNSATGHSVKLNAKVLEISQVQPPPRVQELLAVSPSTPVWRMKRVRIFHKRPVSHFLNYWRTDVCGKLPKAEVESRSFIEVFQKESGIKLQRLDQNVKASVADMELSEILEVDYGAPLFYVENDYFADSDNPIVITHMYYRGDSYVYKASIPFD